MAFSAIWLLARAIKPNVAGTVSLTAKWIENNQPVLNAHITGKIVEQEKEIQFFDDGRHADGAADDACFERLVKWISVRN